MAFPTAVNNQITDSVTQVNTKVLGDAHIHDWRETLVFTLLDAVEHHPLARRLLSGLEPDVTARTNRLVDWFLADVAGLDVLGGETIADQVDEVVVVEGAAGRVVDP